MARKRTKANEEKEQLTEQPTETTTAVAERQPDVFDEQIALRNAERAQREAEQRTEPSAPTEPTTHTAHHAPHREHGQSHAEAVGKKEFKPLTEIERGSDQCDRVLGAYTCVPPIDEQLDAGHKALSVSSWCLKSAGAAQPDAAIAYFAAKALTPIAKGVRYVGQAYAGGSFSCG
jgi:hypothetical protein